MIPSKFLPEPKPQPHPPSVLSLTQDLTMIAYFAPTDNEGQFVGRFGDPGQAREEAQEGVCEVSIFGTGLSLVMKDGEGEKV